MVDPCGLDSRYSLSGAVLVSHHGVKRRGSDAQCIPAAGSETRIPDATPSISNSLLGFNPSILLLFFFFKGETFKELCFFSFSQLQSSSIQTAVTQFPKHITSVWVVFRDTRKSLGKKAHLLLNVQVQKKSEVFTRNSLFLFLLYIKTQ